MAGAKLYACKATADLRRAHEAHSIDEIEGIISVGEFHDFAAGRQIIFT